VGWVVAHPPGPNALPRDARGLCKFQPKNPFPHAPPYPAPEHPMPWRLTAFSVALCVRCPSLQRCIAAGGHGLVYEGTLGALGVSRPTSVAVKATPLHAPENVHEIAAVGVARACPHPPTPFAPHTHSAQGRGCMPPPLPL
jgi:hypothetical protein